jgi:putative PIN family toxin of toxin-antitoxin system
VLDTNVLVSGVLFEGGNEAKILQLAATGDIEVFISPDILAEFLEVLSRPKFRLAEGEVSTVFSFLLAVTKLTIPLRGVRTQLRDPDDLKLLACAVEAKATHVVTGDKDLLTIRKSNRATILTPSKFIRHLKTIDLIGSSKRNFDLA